MLPDSPPGEDHSRKVRPLEPTHPSIFTTGSSCTQGCWSCCRVAPPLEPSNPPPPKKKCNKEDKRNFQDMMRIKQFDSPRRGVARHADDLPRRAVLSRWLTLEGGAGPGIKADSLPHSSTLKVGLRGEHLLPISWHRRRAPQMMRLVFPDDRRDPLGPSPRRLARGVCLIQF